MASLTVTGNDPINEYDPGVNVGVTVTSNVSVDGNVTAVYVFKGPNTTGPNITINGSSVNITGAYAEIFPKSITYLDVNRAPQTIPKFEDLPAKFFLLTNYTASHSSSVVAEYYVTADLDGQTGGGHGGSSSPQSNVLMGTVTQTVTNDYTAGKNALQAAVPKGIF